MSRIRLGKIAFCLLTTVVLMSCSVKKRVYRDGYYVDWAFNKNTAAPRHETVKTDNGRLKEEVVTLTPEVFKGTLAAAAKEQEQLIVSADKKFKPSGNYTPNRLKRALPQLEEHKSDVSKNSVVTKKKKNVAAKPSSGGKSQLAALLFCIFLGCIGVHRFYLGYIGIGILQILTLGGCGIWALIDLILIITGDLKPKNGDYTETI